MDLPVREILERDEAADFPRTADELARDVAAVETVVGGEDGLLAALPGGEGLLLGVDELPERRREVGLPEDLAGLRRLVAGAGEEDAARVGPLQEPVALARHGRDVLLLDRVAVGHLDRRREDVGQRELSVLGQHHHDPAGRPRRDGGERAVLRRVGHPFRTEELRRRPRGCHAECVDADHLARVRIEDERLRLAPPGEGVPHGAGRGDHGAGRVDGVAPLLEDHRARRGAERLAGDRDPLRGVERGLVRGRRGDEGEGDRGRARREEERRRAASGSSVFIRVSFGRAALPGYGSAYNGSVKPSHLSLAIDGQRRSRTILFENIRR